MGRTSKIIGLLVCLSGLVSCRAVDPKEAIGSWEYVRGPRRSCIDVLPDGTYRHVIYNQGTLELQTESNWTIDAMGGETRVTFEKFQHLTDEGDLYKNRGFWPVAPSRTFFSGELQLRLSDDLNLFYRRLDKPCL